MATHQSPGQEWTSQMGRDVALVSKEDGVCEG
jgi:hypothetical protein